MPIGFHEPGSNVTPLTPCGNSSPRWPSGIGTPLDAGADRLGGVLDQVQPVLVAELAQRRHVGRVAAHVHGDHGARARRDPARDVGRDRGSGASGETTSASTGVAPT